MKLTKLSGCTENFENVAEFSEPVKVQGGLKCESGNLVKVVSGGRFKLFTKTRDYVKFLAGNGHFKWARGETAFAEKDVFLIEEAGEYEINGKCEFLVLRK